MTPDRSTKSSKEKEVLITYVFDAPRELVFKAWTDPEQLKDWYAPSGCTIEFRSIDVRPGGTFHSCVHNPVFGDCWIKGIYQEVVFPERLVFSMILADEAGNAVTSAEAGKQEDWPEATVTTVFLVAEGNTTRLTLHQTVSEAAARESGAYQSWIEMFHLLNELVIKQ